MDEVAAWDLTSRQDHGRSAKRAVTLIQAEHLPVIGQLSGLAVEHAQTRRNLLVRGINLASLQGFEFSVGEVVLSLTEICEPCTLMEETIGEGALAAMTGMGGWCARIVHPGSIRVGDRLRRLGPVQPRKT